MGSATKLALAQTGLESSAPQALRDQYAASYSGVTGFHTLAAPPHIRSVGTYPTGDGVFDRVYDLSESYNGFCITGPNSQKQATPPNLPPNAEFFSVRNGEPAALEMQYMMELVFAQSFPSSDAEWESRMPEERLTILQNAVRQAFVAIGLPAPSVSNVEQGDAGQYMRGQWKIRVSDGVIGKRQNSPLASESNPPATRLEALRTIVHESQHALQDFWLLSWFSGHGDAELSEVMRKVKAQLHNDNALNKGPMSRVWELARKYPTKVNARVKALVDGWPRDIELRNAYLANPSDENYKRLYGQGMEAQAERAAFSALHCRQVLDLTSRERSK